MSTKNFKVFSLCNEISLDKVAAHFGVNKKYKWEESLRLTENNLKGVIQSPENKMVNIFHFGSIVFINMEHHEITDVVNYLKKIEKNLSNATYDYSDDYFLEISDKPKAIYHDKMLVRQYEDYQVEILSIVLAKSVALEKIESGVDNLVDGIEDMVDRLERGILSAKDEQLAKMAARILGFKYNTLSYIMLLDKPDITWEQQAAEELYTELAQFFELKDRYDKIQAKSETLMDITEVFSSLSHQSKGNKLEWAVIILIAIEIVLTLFEFIFLM